MKRSFFILSLTILFFFGNLTQTFASSISNNFHPNSSDPNFQKKVSYELFVSLGIQYIRFIQYTPGLLIREENILNVTVWEVKPNELVWIDRSCAGYVAVEFLKSDMDKSGSVGLGETTSNLTEGSCVAPTITPSNLDYVSDTYTAPADGSGGDGTTGFISVVSSEVPSNEPEPEPEPEPDFDGDGIPDSIDDDDDGDGIPDLYDFDKNDNGIEDHLEDVDGDGLDNANDPDIDGDGLPNGDDPDMDGDGLPNGDDPDMDSDGLPNGDDPDMDSDGLPNGDDPDMDSDGLPNGDDPDMDSDGLKNSDDPDMDSDGLPNGDDPDMDSDGIDNSIDSDSDGDGLSNADEDIINALEPVLNEIRDSLSDLEVSINLNIDELTSVVDSIKGELQSDLNVSNPVVPVVSVPSGSGLIEMDKPVSTKTSVEDTTDYFSDQGDVLEIPTAMPSVPDIVDWNGVIQEPSLLKDSEVLKSSEVAKSSELVKDSFSQDVEFPKSSEVAKSSELVKDSFSQDPIMQKQPMTKTNVFNQSGQMTQTNTFVQDSPMVVTQ